MDRSLPSKRWLSCRASTTSLGEPPSVDFPSEAVGDGEGVNLTGTGFLYESVRDGEGFDSTDFVVLL